MSKSPFSPASSSNSSQANDALPGDDEKDTNLSYTAMIAQAIMVTAGKRATLAEIYEYMSNTFQILKKRGSGWRNCVRHTLSLNECFLKLHRPENGRSCNWTVHPAYFDAFSKGDYRKRRANRKKTRAMPWLDDRAAAITYTQPLGLPYGLREPDMRGMRSAAEEIPRIVTTDQVWQGYMPGIKQEQYTGVTTFPYDNRLLHQQQTSQMQPANQFANTLFPSADQQYQAMATPASLNSELTTEPRFTQQRQAKDNRQTYQNQMEGYNIADSTPTPAQYGLDPNCLTSSTFATRSYRQEFF